MYSIYSYELSCFPPIFFISVREALSASYVMYKLNNFDGWGEADDIITQHMLLAHRYKQTQMVVALPGHSRINNYMMFELTFASYIYNEVDFVRPTHPQNYTDPDPTQT
jgi:hypothetical protein